MFSPGAGGGAEEGLGGDHKGASPAVAAVTRTGGKTGAQSRREVQVPPTRTSEVPLKPEEEQRSCGALTQQEWQPAPSGTPAGPDRLLEPRLDPDEGSGFGYTLA